MNKIQNITNRLNDIKECFEKYASYGVGKEALEKYMTTIMGKGGYLTYLLGEMKFLDAKDRPELGEKFNQFKTDIENIYEKYKNLPETIKEIPLG